MEAISHITGLEEEIMGVQK